ncbi:response regulator transcription factor [Reinekea marinisedimentorum]|uniref:Two-component system OmpR family response regulator n=1 Tax=Reinekea marinisedimentorum TaxID=230495 RepID=A0A4R3IA20_9GAMM|nr:response regulator transcription factor [Reinekea marinisedimentorum]TCS43269.1 two-component system OmpR family response regulator [Reinekea marinisedimentorum]
MKQRLLVVDDNPGVTTLLADVFASQNFEVQQAENGLVALRLMESFRPDIVLLDIMMPEMDGFEFLQKIRRTSDVPVIMITAKQHENDAIKGFQLGADDYIVKPFRIRELSMRIQAILRRSRFAKIDREELNVGQLKINRANNEVQLAGKKIDLTTTEFHLLELMANRAEHTVSKADLCMHLIDQGCSGSESTLKIHIRNLRSKIEQQGNDQTRIETVFGVGYRMRITE